MWQPIDKCGYEDISSGIIWHLLFFKEWRLNILGKSWRLIYLKRKPSQVLPEKDTLCLVRIISSASATSFLKSKAWHIDCSRKWYSWMHLCKTSVYESDMITEMKCFCWRGSLETIETHCLSAMNNLLKPLNSLNLQYYCSEETFVIIWHNLFYNTKALTSVWKIKCSFLEKVMMSYYTNEQYLFRKQVVL